MKYIEEVENMADLKATSFRLNEEDLEKFKQFTTDNGLNQAEAFKSIMQTVEMARAKGMIKDRGKEIEVFQDTINNLMSMFLNSLNVNQTSEERIREELSKELQTKDNTISNLYEQLQELKADKINSDNIAEDLERKYNEIQEQLQKVNSEILEKNKSIDKLNSNNDLLQDQLKEYKQYKDNYKPLEKELDQVKADNSNKDNNIKSLENNIMQLQDKIKNDSEMIEFYRANNTELKANIKAIEEECKQEIQEVKKDHEKALSGQIEAIKDQLEGKYNLEIERKALEIQKLQNEIDILKTKPKATKPNNNK